MIRSPVKTPAPGPPFGINTRGKLQRGGKKNPCDKGLKVARMLPPRIQGVQAALGAKGMILVALCPGWTARRL